MTPEVFQYALLRLVPDIARGECINVGVVVFSRRHGFLRARVADVADCPRVAGFAPGADRAGLAAHLDALARVAAGDASAGPVAKLEPSERFHWLAAPSSTAIQPSEVHTGLTDDPAATLDRLFAQLVHARRAR